tara:strand:+ start:246 stop:392 length:147 start_codon:yes stop_codon:yes gene_type:complete
VKVTPKKFFEKNFASGKPVSISFIKEKIDINIASTKIRQGNENNKTKA